MWLLVGGVDALLASDPRDPIEQFDDDAHDPAATAPRLTKRQRRNLRGASLMQSFRNGVHNREQALKLYSKTKYSKRHT